jgi:hypothetical protein
MLGMRRRVDMWHRGGDSICQGSGNVWSRRRRGQAAPERRLLRAPVTEEEVGHGGRGEGF